VLQGKKLSNERCEETEVMVQISVIKGICIDVPNPAIPYLAKSIFNISNYMATTPLL
jgi:hypothetical protein